MFDNYVGQQHIKKVLSQLITYHKTAIEPMQHMLITGNSGLGKTALTNTIAKELGTNCISLLATNANEQDLIKAICSLRDKDILFLDELHALNKKLVEILFPIITEHTLYTMYQGVMTRFKVNNFTIIGATDRPGILNPALLNRFQLTLNLKPYTEEEFIQLIRLHTKDYIISDELCRDIIKLCKDVPRILLNIVGSIKIYLNSVGKTILTIEDLNVIREFLGVDTLGLDSTDLTILKFLYDNGASSLKTLACVCGCLPTNIENIYEPNLIKLGFINKASNGRTITDKGKRYIEIL